MSPNPFLIKHLETASVLAFVILLYNTNGKYCWKGRVIEKFFDPQSNILHVVSFLNPPRPPQKKHTPHPKTNIHYLQEAYAIFVVFKT